APGVWILNLLNRGIPTGITISDNSIHDNTGLGIDLDLGDTVPRPPYGVTTPGINPDGPTPNDSPNQATGPNHFHNHPVLSSVTAGPGSTTITGTFHSTPNGTFRLEFYDSANAHSFAGDPNLYGEGKDYLGAITVTTDAIGNLATSPDGSAIITFDTNTQQ